MAKQVKRTHVDEPALVEPKSFEELTQRAHKAALNDRGELERAPRFWDCFNGPDHLGHNDCFPILKGVAALGYLTMAVALATLLISKGGGWVFQQDHIMIRLFAAAARYTATGGLAAIATGWIGGYCSWIRNGRRCQTHTQKKLDGPIAKHVTAYLGKLISEEQSRLIGTDSEIEGLRSRTDDVLQRAQTLKERLAARVREEQRRAEESVPAYLSAAFERAEKLVTRLARSRDRLNEHRAKLDAFFESCRARVQAAEKPLNDLELVEAVEVLDAEGEQLGTEVQEVIIRSTGELYGRLQQLRSTLGISLAHAGVHLALATPTTSNLERDASVLEDTIARFRPPKVIEGDDADAPRAPAARQIGIT